MDSETDMWKMVETAIEHLRVVCVCGKPGIGKTYAAQNGQNPEGVVSVNLSEDTVVQELFGHYVPEGNRFVYHDGPVIDAMRNGKVMVVNELGRASRAVQDALLGALDSIASARVTLPSGETVTAHNGFRAIITSNDTVENLDQALRDRCESVINLTEPHPDLVKALNEAMPSLGDAVRESYSDPDRAISTRASFAFAKLVNAGVPEKVAGTLAYGPRADDILNTLRLRKSATAGKP